MKLAGSRFCPLSGLVMLAALAVAAAACGSDDSPCIKTGKTICAAACNCGGGSGCAIGDDSGAISFDNNSGCVMLYSLGCSNDDGSIDFAACQSALASPMCVQSSDGPALDLPAACQ